MMNMRFISHYDNNVPQRMHHQARNTDWLCEPPVRSAAPLMKRLVNPLLWNHRVSQVGGLRGLDQKDCT